MNRIISQISGKTTEFTQWVNDRVLPLLSWAIMGFIVGMYIRLLIECSLSLNSITYLIQAKTNYYQTSEKVLLYRFGGLI